MHKRSEEVKRKTEAGFFMLPRNASYGHAITDIN